MLILGIFETGPTPSRCILKRVPTENFMGQYWSMNLKKGANRRTFFTENVDRLSGKPQVLSHVNLVLQDGGVIDTESEADKSPSPKRLKSVAIPPPRSTSSPAVKRGRAPSCKRGDRDTALPLSSAAAGQASPLQASQDGAHSEVPATPASVLRGFLHRTR